MSASSRRPRSMVGAFRASGRNSISPPKRPVGNRYPKTAMRGSGVSPARRASVSAGKGRLACRRPRFPTCSTSWSVGPPCCSSPRPGSGRTRWRCLVLCCRPQGREHALGLLSPIVAARATARRGKGQARAQARIPRRAARADSSLHHATRPRHRGLPNLLSEDASYAYVGLSAGVHPASSASRVMCRDTATAK